MALNAARQAQNFRHQCDMVISTILRDDIGNPPKGTGSPMRESRNLHLKE